MNVYFLISAVSNFFLFGAVIYFNWLLNESYKWRSVLEDECSRLEKVNWELRNAWRLKEGEYDRQNLESPIGDS